MDGRSTWRYGLKSLVGAGLLICSSWIHTPLAQGLALRDGDYVTERGWGKLSIRSDKNGRSQTFSIQAIGVNAHECSLDGRVRGGKATLNSDYSEGPCNIEFKALPEGSIAVMPNESNHRACSGFCGARAYFSGTYLPLPSECSRSGVDKIRAEFKRAYDRKDFAQARSALEAPFIKCEKQLHYPVRDRMANDLALTQNHLGDDEGCRKTLASLVELASTADAKINAPPAEEDVVRSIVRATRTNLRLCKFPLTVGSGK